MGCIKLVFDNISKTEDLKSENGFSLIELLAALFILTLIIFAFTPLLISSLYNIHYAGDKTEALHEGQSEIEVDIAELRTVDGHELEFIFGDPEGDHTSILVAGGLVEVDTSKGEASAWLSGFVPNVPTIFIIPSMIREGYDDELIVTIKGRDTEFAEAKTVLIKDGIDGTIKQEQTIENISDHAGDNYDEEAVFKLSDGLTNIDSPYMVSVSWEIEDDITVTARARLYVKMPRALAVGEGRSMMLSPDGMETWNEIDSDRIPGETGFGSFYDVVWTYAGRKYALVSATGHIIIWVQGEDLKTIGPRSDGSLYSVTYGDREFIAVGEEGHVITVSADNYNYNNKYILGSDSLKAVEWNDEEELLIAVGENGTIFSSVVSSPGSGDWIEYDWEDNEENYNPEFTLNGVAYGNNSWYIVGDDAGQAVMFKYSNGSVDRIEDEVINSASALNDIIYDGSRFIAVGDNATMLKSSNGDDWVEVEDLGNNNFVAIDWREIEESTYYLVVDDNGTISGGNVGEWENWSYTETGDKIIYGVAINWTR